MNIAYNELDGNYLSVIGRTNPTFWNVRDSDPFLPSSYVALIIDGQVVTSAIKKKFRLTTNVDALYDHIIKQEKWITQIFDSIN